MTANAKPISSVQEQNSAKLAPASGIFHIAGELPIHRLGFGAMRITGKGVWGEPHDHDEVIRVLRRALELGVNFIDTADSYGPEVSERLIAEALHPYPKDLVIATKAGFDRSGPGQWTMNGNPKHLRDACEGSLRRLRLSALICINCIASILDIRQRINSVCSRIFRLREKFATQDFQR